MARATRSFETDTAELSYQIGRSDGFARIVADFRGGRIDDQEAQEQLLELLDMGRCQFFGDHGPEEWSWKISEREQASLVGQLVREHLGS